MMMDTTINSSAIFNHSSLFLSISFNERFYNDGCEVIIIIISHMISDCLGITDTYVVFTIHSTLAHGNKIKFKRN